MRIGLLHGFAGDPRVWDAVLAAWHRPDELVALALHAMPVRDTWDANLAAVASALGDVDLVIGYSLGARLALGLIATESAPRAILVSVNPGIADAEREARRAGDARWARLLREHGIAAFVDAWQAQPLFATQARHPERVATRHARRLALDPEQLARSLEVMGLAEMPDYRAAASRDRIALVAGADDAKYVELARSLGAPLRVLADCGHDPTLEQPAALAAALAELG